MLANNNNNNNNGYKRKQNVKMLANNNGYKRKTKCFDALASKIKYYNLYLGGLQNYTISSASLA